MIVVELIGGLGNQMFQYAIGKSLAHKHNTDLYLDLTKLSNKTTAEFTGREFSLNVFNINAKIATESQLNLFKRNGRNFILKIFNKIFSFFYTIKFEKDFSYQSDFENYANNTYLSGFWQSEKYFLSIKSILKKEFSFIVTPNQENLNWIQLINQTNSVSLHIRRGDYVSIKSVNDLIGICDMEYYIKAIDYIFTYIENPTFFVFSDDINWCKENLKFPVNTKSYFIGNNSNEYFFEDMRLMSLCKHNIIANSTFSWWAAWLNDNPNKKVICPKHWFNDKTINEQKNTELNLESWISF